MMPQDDGQEKQRVLVAGAGALGMVFGALLHRDGHAVTLLGRPALLETIGARGLDIEGLWGAHHVTGLRLARNAADISDVFDAVLVTVKTYDTRTMAQAVTPLLAPQGVMISLQNGLGNAEILAEQAGAGRVLAGRVIFGAEVLAPGRVGVTVYAEPVLLGAWRTAGGTPLDGQARAWAERFTRAGIPTDYCHDILAALWGKVLYNAALNPVGALLGVHYGALSEDANARAVMDAVIEEAFAVARAEGIALPWGSAAAYRAVFYDRLVPSTYNHRSSMLQDLERGRRTEIDAINGEVWRRGRIHGIAAPVNEVLTRLVHTREVVQSGDQR
jgi:2-dehydropantoate 2-reductase